MSSQLPGGFPAPLWDGGRVFGRSPVGSPQLPGSFPMLRAFCCSPGSSCFPGLSLTAPPWLLWVVRAFGDSGGPWRLHAAPKRLPGVERAFGRSPSSYGPWRFLLFPGGRPKVVRAFEFPQIPNVSWRLPTDHSSPSGSPTALWCGACFCSFPWRPPALSYGFARPTPARLGTPDVHHPQFDLKSELKNVLT